MVRDFRFEFDRLGRVVMGPMGMGPRNCVIRLDGDTLEVRLGWGFRSRIPRRSIVDARRRERVSFSRGAHGWRGRWLVNGSATHLVSITVDPPARGAVIGWPVRVRELMLSVEEPDELVETLRSPVL
ncbi:MAG TPA: hypothetical protein VMS14_09115 [Ilumatobacteraceae bacterium]|nr:hypothetical protein [Ilumatobacteraceae bacterium]HUC33549.1 hypothetical protein [Ilumatobacteraceae bacterium]